MPSSQFLAENDGDVGPAKVKVGLPSSLRSAHPVFQPALHFRSNTAVDQLKGVEMLRPLRLFLGLSGINQQSPYHTAVPSAPEPHPAAPTAADPDRNPVDTAGDG